MRLPLPGAGRGWGRSLAVALVLSVLVPGELAVEAQTARIEGRVISTGMSKGRVFMITGEPDWRTHYVIEWRNPPLFPNGDGTLAPPRGSGLGSRSLTSPEGHYTLRRVNVEEWLFNQGSNRFMQLLRFEDQELVGIDKLGYGFRPHRGTVSADWGTLRKGETTYEVRARFGEPTLTDFGEEERLLDGHGEFPRFRVSTVQWWYYNTGPNDLFRKIKFVDGRVVTIDVEGSGFSH